MAFWKKGSKVSVNTAPVVDDGSVGTAADVEAVMKKYDRESNTRLWEGVPKTVIRWIMVLFSVWSIYVTLFSNALPEVRLSLFVGMVLVMGFLNFPARKDHVKVNSMPWYDIIIMVLGSGAFFYYAINAQAIIKLSLRASKVPLLLVLGVFQTGFAFICLGEGLKVTPSVTASLVSGLEPVLNPVLVAVFYHEYIGLTALVGAFIVVGGVVGYNILLNRQTTQITS